MKMHRLLIVAALGVMLCGCGGNDFREEDCYTDLKFQNRTVARPIAVPEGLDPLDDLREMPIPRADPNAASPPAGQCIDAPPLVRMGN